MAKQLAKGFLINVLLRVSIFTKGFSSCSYLKDKLQKKSPETHFFLWTSSGFICHLAAVI